MVDKKCFLEQVRLSHFRIFEELELELSPGVNGFSGNNGAGKTNFLDAVYYLTMAKSYFHASEQYNYRHQSDFFRIEGQFKSGDDVFHTKFKIVKGQKKELTFNFSKEEKLSSYVGKFPCVIITPDDNAIILGGSEERRRLLDATLCQLNPVYTEQLMLYNRILQQRNATLKQFAQSGQINHDWLDAIDAQLIPLNFQIHQERKSFIEAFHPLVESIFAHISGEIETANVVYDSSLNQNSPKDLLRNTRARDLILQRTSRGIHTDDLDLLLNGYPVRKVGSQGQQKSFLVALKMAQYLLLRNRKNLSPILLLDDIFDKFDENRVAKVFDLIHKESLGQVFISDTHPERLAAFIRQTTEMHQLFKVNAGHVEKY